MAARKAEVIITCDATTVKQVLEGLNREMEKTNQRRQQLQQKQQAGIRLTKAEEKELQQLVKYENALAERQQKATGEMRKFGEVMKDLAGSKTKDLKRALNEGKRALDNMSAKDPNRQKLIDDLRQIQRQIEKNTAGMQKFGATHNAIWQTAVRNITAYMGVFAAFNWVKTKLSDITKKNYELSDSIMNVRKVSGLTVDDINQLYANIAKIDTRNTVNTLMNLAYQGGKLGIGNYGVEGLTGFVKAAEQVQMALGEDLGEEALPALAKLTENMGLIKDMGVEQAMQKTASAMFMLSTTSVSTGQGIVDFSKRLMPVAKSAGVTTDQLLGLASATESSGLAAEVAATAFVKMFPSIYKNADALETYLGLQKGFIRESYDQGKAMDAMVSVFDKMSKMGNINKHPEIFKLLGSEGARMNTVMTAMANNVDMLRDHLNTSNIAFKEGTAVINEYNMQNNSAAGILERANNIWEKAFVNPEGVDTVKELAVAWKQMAEELTGSESWMYGAKKSLEAIASVIGIIIKLAPTLIRALMFYGVATAIRKVYIEFTMLNGAMAAATTSAGKLGAFFKSNIWVLGATAIAFAATALIDMAASAKKAKDEIEAAGDALENASKEGERASAKERAELKKLYEATQDVTKSMEERTKAALDMKRKYPSYFSDLTTEQILAGKAADAYANLAQQILNAAKARAMEKKIEELQTENMNLEDDNKRREQWKKDNQKKYDEEKAKNDRAVNQQNRMEVTGADGVGSKMGYVHASNTGDKQLIGQYQQNDQTIDNNTKKIAENTATMNRLSDEVSKIKPASTTIEPETFTPGGGGGDNGSGGTTDKDKELKDKFNETKKDVEGLIAKIDEWYNLQEAAVKDAEATGEMTKKEADDLVQAMEIARNDSLMRARKAVGSGSQKAIDDWKLWAKTVLPSMLADSSEWSKDLMSTIQEVDAKALHDFLATLKEQTDDPKVMAMLDASSFFDTMMKKGAESKKKAEVLRAKFTETLDNYVKQYNVLIQAQDKMRDDLQSLGIMTETPEQMAERIMSGKEAPDDRRQFAQMSSKFIGMNTIPYTIDITNKDDALYFIEQLTHDGEGAMEQWAQAFPKLMEWVNLYQQNALQGEHLGDAEKKAIEEAMPQIQALYYQLMNYADNVSANIKKQVEQMMPDNAIGIGEMTDRHQRQVKLTGSLYDQKIDEANAAGDASTAVQLEREKNQAIIELEYQFANEMYQIQQQMGVNWGEELQHEIAMYKNMLDRQLISEKQFQQKKKQLQATTGMKYAQYFNDQMKSLVDALQSYEIQATENKYDAQIQAAQAAGQSTTAIEEEKEAAIYETRRKYAGMELAIKISEIGVNTAVAIMQAFAQLGPIAGGIAAGMITALGAAQTALAIAEYQKVMGSGATSSSTSTSSASTAKLKLGAGMLTYDNGNVQSYVGNDGNVYQARQQDSIPEGVSIVKSPIATMVNGEPSLVAEKGPELVVGRKTTRAIMMNEPELLKRLAYYNRNNGSYGSGLRTLDNGNIEDMTGPQSNSAAGTTIDAETAAALRMLPMAMGALTEQLKKPVHINMYGKDSLDESMNERDRFRKRHPV